MSRDLSPILPQACLVRFPGRRCSGTPDQSTPTWYTHKVTLSSLIDDLNTDLTNWEQTLPSDLVGSIGNAVFHETTQALFNPPGADPTNKATLDSLAEVIARDFYRWRLIGFDLVYRGILNPLPTALYDDIEWRYRASGVKTRLLSSSLGGVNAGGGGGGSVEELNHSDGLHEKDCKDPDNLSTIVSKLPLAEMYGPPSKGSTASMVLPVFLVGIVDGRLQATYERTEDLSCGCVEGCKVCTIVSDFCTGQPIPGVMVTVSQGATTIGTCTTGVDGKCCIDVPASGSYTVTSSESHYDDPTSVTLFVRCPGAATAVFSLHPKSGHYFLVVVIYGKVRTTEACILSPLSDPSISITITDDFGAPAGSGSGGFAFIDVPGPGHYTVTASWLPRYDVSSTDITLTEATCGNAAYVLVTIPIAAGYNCTPFCVYPLKDSLLGLDPIFGAFSLTWDFASGTYTGSQLGFYPGGHVTGGVGFVGHDCPPDSVPISYVFETDIIGPKLLIVYSADIDTNCPGTGTGFWRTGATAQLGDEVFCPPYEVLFTLDTPPTNPGGGCTGGSFCTPLYPGVYTFRITET